MPKLMLEISCASAADALVAESAGADRVELCSALFLGGLTPSPGAIFQAATRLKIPFVVMVRPRSGDFCYSDAEFTVMERDVDFAMQNGAAGVVFGILRPDGSVDVGRCKRLQQFAGGGSTVFHRAFDVVPDAFRALNGLIELGFTRVLTSGQCSTAMEGANLIARLIEHARDRIQILPGGGIRAYNVKDLIRQTGCTQVHLSGVKIKTGMMPTA